MTPTEKNKEYQRRYKEKYPERVRERERRYWRNNIERKLWHHAKNRASKQDRDFNIEISDITIPEYCPILGIPIFVGTGKVSNNSPSIDRIDSSKGYIKGNIEVISHKANRLKGDLSFEEVQKLLEYMNRKDEHGPKRTDL